MSATDFEDFAIDLPDAPEGLKEIELLSNPAEPYEIEIFASGCGYEEYMRKKQNPSLLSIEPRNYDLDDLSNGASKKGEKKQSVKDLLMLDFYELLEITETGWDTNDEDVRKAHRKAILRLHPDKLAQSAGGDEGEVNDELFKRVQQALIILTNPSKKKKYDSSLPFDETIPTADDVKTDADFYKVFRPVFLSNGKFSSIQPVPDLGDEKTHIKDVEKFYSFWRGFKTWRDFSYLFAETAEDNSKSRDERRHQERKNAKEKSQRDAAEFVRLNKLVDIAEELDPRMKAEREKQKQKKEEEKKKRFNEVENRRLEEEAKKKEIADKEAEEKRIAAEKEEAEKAERTRIVNAKKKRRQQMRKFTKEHDLPDDWVEFIALRLDLEPLNTFVKELEALPNVKATIDHHFQARMAIIRGKAAPPPPTAAAAVVVAAAPTPVVEVPVHWTADEIDALTKAVIKFPAGTQGRWEKIQGAIGTDKNIGQIIARVKSGQNVTPAAEKKEIVDQQPTLQIKHKDTTGMKNDPNAAEASINWEKVLEAESIEAEKKEKEEKKEAAVPVISEDPVLNWTQEAQKALEDAIKKYPASIVGRWEMIASEVPGKSKKECMDRFKHLVAVMKGKK